MIHSSRVKRKDKNTLIKDGEKEIEKPVTYEKETEKYKYKIIIEDFAIPIKDWEYAKDWVNNGYNRAYISGFILYSKK